MAPLRVGAIGVGQCGNKMLKPFLERKLPILAVNTTELDMKIFGIKEGRCLIPASGTGGGAGKKPSIGAAAARQHAEVIQEMMAAQFKDTGILMYITGLGGGTGTGATPVIFDMGTDVPRRMLVVTLPHNGEGVDEKINAVNAFRNIWDSARAELVPVVVIDNDKVMDAVDKGLVTQARANEEIFENFFRVCELVDRESNVSSFDPMDFDTVLNSSGRMVICRSTESCGKDFDRSRENMARIIQQSWKQGYLYDCDFAPEKAVSAAILVVVPQKKATDAFMSQVVQRGINLASEGLEATKCFVGIYASETDTEFIEVVTLFAGLAPPDEKYATLHGSAVATASSLKAKVAERRQADDRLAKYDEIVLDVEEERPRKVAAAPPLTLVSTAGAEGPDLTAYYEQKRQQGAK